MLLMEKIGKVKLGLSKDYEVLVESDVMMSGKEDKDDLYFIMFNVMNEPLRLSVITVGNLVQFAEKNSDYSRDELMQMCEDEAEKFVSLALGDGSAVVENGVEKIQVPLDSSENANKARLIISSMIEKGYFLQKTNYSVDGEIIRREQQVDTNEMKPQLHIMLEIIKRWDNLDLDELAKFLG